MNKKIKNIAIFFAILFSFFLNTSSAFAQEIIVADSGVCTMDAHMCPNGKFVGRTGPKCEFVCDGKVQIPEVSGNSAERRADLISELKRQIKELQEQIKQIIEIRNNDKVTFYNNLKIGSTDRTTNGEVTKLQKLLISENVYQEKIVSGYYGKLTSKAVQKLKEKYNIDEYPGVEWNPKVYNIFEARKKGGPVFPSVINNSISLKNNTIELPSNIMTVKECAGAGGEVFNTLGKTSYNGEFIGKIEELRCPCACLIKNEKIDVLWIIKNGNKEEFKGKLNNIQTFEDCKNAGFKILKTSPDICQIGESYMTGGKYKTFRNNPMKNGKTCTDYHYSTCPGSCVAKCVASSCSEPMEDGTIACTSDCDGPGSCVEKK